MKTSLLIVISLIVVSLSDTQNGDCVVKRIDHGRIQISRVGAAYFSLLHLGYVRDTTYENIPLRERIPHGKAVYLTCLDGFAVQGMKGQGRVPVTCKEGRWAPDAICLMIRCTKPPPKINHGRAENFSSNHRSIAKYVCDDSYELSGSNKVECLLGEWKGVPPRCVENRCFFSELKHRSGISSETEAFTNSGSQLGVICEEGFSLNRTAPLCLEGQWRRNSESPCRENDCIVRRISNGKIQLSRVGPAYFSFRTFRYENCVTYENVPLERKIRHGVMVYLDCKDGFTFQGKTGEFRFPVYCKKGRWEPVPECLHTSYCTLEMLLKMLPKAVAPSMENIRSDQALPEGFEMKLHCERDLVLKGSPIATCTSGLWKFGGPTSATYCSPACRVNVNASSRLNIYPEKELFLLGEFVYFWCPYKYRMSQRIEKAMCLSGVWSNPAPDCVPL